jgi:hypothetical protein
MSLESSGSKRTPEESRDFLEYCYLHQKAVYIVREWMNEDSRKLREEAEAAILELEKVEMASLW